MKRTKKQIKQGMQFNFIFETYLWPHWAFWKSYGSRTWTLSVLLESRLDRKCTNRTYTNLFRKIKSISWRAHERLTLFSENWDHWLLNMDNILQNTTKFQNYCFDVLALISIYMSVLISQMKDEYINIV